MDLVHSITCRGEAGRVMEYLISADGSNTVGLISGCRTTQLSFFFHYPDAEKPNMTEWIIRFSGSDPQHRLKKIQDCGIWAVSTMTSGTIFAFEGSPLKRAGRKELVKLFLAPSSRHVTGWQRSKNIWTVLLAPELLTVCLSPIALTPSEIHPSEPGLDVLVEIPMSVSRLADVKLYSRWKKDNNGKASIRYFKLTNAWNQSNLFGQKAVVTSPYSWQTNI